MVSRTLRHPNIEPAHPGELLGEIIPATGKSYIAVAALLGVSRQTLHQIVAQKRAITPAMAVRLGKLFGNGPELWLSMQQAHDLWHARRELQETLKRMPTLKGAA